MNITAQRLSFRKKQSFKGFTLVELLIVIAIIAILAAVVVLIINPLELTRRGRDAARLSDLANLQQAINVAVQETAAPGGAILCNGAAYPCGGTAAGAANGQSHVSSRASDGTGWVKVNLGTQQSVSLPTLPADPSNNATHHYTYCADADQWEINTTLESTQFAVTRDYDATDGGDDNTLYEVGSNLNLIQPDTTPCAY